MSSKRILLAYDGSACADAAILDLKRAGLPPKVSLLVVSVADVFLPPATGLTEESIPESVVVSVQKGWDLADQKVKEAKALAQKAAKKIKTSFPGWQVQAESFADSPSWGVLRKAKEWKADLIVIGAHGLPSPGRIMLGSVSQMIATQASCSVRIVRGKSEDVKSPCRIVIGVDGSAASGKAIDEAALRIWKKGSAVHLVTVRDSRILTAGHLTAKTLHRRVEEAKRKLGSRGLIVTALDKAGDPKKVLLQEAERWGADSLFVGARGLTGVKHLLIGSVSASLAARAHCTVEIVR